MARRQQSGDAWHGPGLPWWASGSRRRVDSAASANTAWTRRATKVIHRLVLDPVADALHRLFSENGVWLTDTFRGDGAVHAQKADGERANDR